MHTPTVSIIVTTYNREKYLKEAIQSILNQSFTDFELIVVDNFSNYNFIKAIEEFDDDRIHAFQNANNGIIAVNRNFGISKAQGKYLAFCDDDDLWLPHKLESQMSLITDKNEKCIVASAIELFGEDSSDGKVLRRKGYCCALERFVNNKVSLSSSLVYRSDSVFFDENPDFVGSEDWALWMKLFILGYCEKHINEPLIRYRVSSTSYTRLNKKQVDLRGIRILKDLKLKYSKEFSYKFYMIGVISLYLKCIIRTIGLK